MNSFLKAFYKQAGTLRKEVSVIAVIKDGKMLMGRRRDNNKWTNAGGHLNPGEKPLDGAVRELEEETGIKVAPEDLTFLKTIKNPKNGYTVHGYKYEPTGKVTTSMKEDPDAEVYRWRFVDTTTIPDKELHVPRSEGNVILSEIEKTAARITHRAILREIAERIPSIASEPKVFEYARDKRRESRQKVAELSLKPPKHEDSWYPKDQIAKGVIVEKEHTDNLAARRIVSKNHLDERRDYYNNALFKSDLEKKAAKFFGGFRSAADRAAHIAKEGDMVKYFKARQAGKQLTDKLMGR